MSEIETTRISLPTGVTLKLAFGGPEDGEPIIFLHGFPESHRTWRDIVPDLARDHFVLASDQRGYARSSKPQGVEHYAADKIVADVVALAEPVLKHRMALTFAARADGETITGIIRRLTARLGG